MYNITITDINKYTYKGYIQDTDLSDKQLDALGLKRDSEYVSELVVEGDFVLEWDYDIPVPQIENCMVYNGSNTIELDVKQLNLESMEHEVSERGDVLNWEIDREASQIDTAYDSYKDGLLD